MHTAGRSTAVFGSSAAMAGLMDDTGCVDVHSDPDSAAFAADVTLVEFVGLNGATSAAERVAQLQQIDRRVAAMALPTDATVIVFAPSAVDDQDEVLAIGVRDVPGDLGDVASLVSPSTRRADYVQLTDVGPTVLQVLGHRCTRVDERHRDRGDAGHVDDVRRAVGRVWPTSPSGSRSATEPLVRSAWCWWC